MRRFAKKFVSLCLVLSLALAFCVPAFAENAKFENYLMISDSVGVYCGDSFDEEKWEHYEDVYLSPDKAFAGTYSDRLKGDLSIQNICSCAHPGWRVQDALYALGGENRTSDYMLAFAGDKLERIDRMRPTFRQGLKEADLISINLGNNNIFQPFIYGLYTAFEKEGISFEGSCCDKAALNSLKRLQADCSVEALADLLSALETMERGTVLLKNVLKMLPDSLADYQRSWDDLIDLITATNPDAKILVLGLYNPIEDLINNVTKDFSLSYSERVIVSGIAKLINNTVDPVIKAYNNYLRNGCKYASKYVYVDITGVNAKLSDSKDGLHLGAVGHEYVYGQMRNAISTHFVSDAVPAKKLTLPGLLGKVASTVKSIFTWR